MNTLKLNGNALKTLGYPEGKALGIALQVAGKHFATVAAEDVLATFKNVLENPENYRQDAILSPIAEELLAVPEEEIVIALKEECGPYAVYGKENIEPGATNQMDIAMRLPVTIGGALMSDAHQGYGMPIGGVLATENAIIPYGVGVDIGCRMALSIFDIPVGHLLENKAKFKRELIAWTKFGSGNDWKGDEIAQHSVLDRAEFNATPLIKSLQGKAAAQLGTSGGGNHFVEWGIIEFAETDTILNVPKGQYVALLTHSGSRGLGNILAGHYTKLAKQLCKLPKEAADLAYFDINSAEGQEYWLAMNLAGDYASACHEVIHLRLAKAIGGQVLAKVENHHNFAWKEKWNGKDVIVHRKGATPASEGVMGIIPGSMVAPGFLVRGKGATASINSASHGAGRLMSRTQAIKTINRDAWRKMLQDNGVSLIGAGLDEAPMAYKNIETVMAAQSSLVDIVAKFTPKMVRMADDGSRED